MKETGGVAQTQTEILVDAREPPFGQVNAAGDMGDLFDEPELPAGFRYIPDVLSPAEEQVLVREFERLPLKPF